MTDVLKVLRLHFLLLAIFAAGRWAMGARGVPYERGHHVFSLVMLTVLSAVFYAAFARRWRGYSAFRAALLGALLGFTTQLVIFASTVLSYGLDLDTYFNHPTALNVTEPMPLAGALVVRARGLLFGSLIPAAAALIGWLLGGLLPPLDAALNTAEPPPPLSGPLPRPRV
jgi:hypothetical protein